MTTANTVEIIEALFTDSEIKKAWRYKDKAKEIQEHVTMPVMDRIDKETGQENDSMYFAYMLQYYFTLKPL